ncbi:MAG: Minf_1886 family protein [Fimbriiglobus sp.]
MDPMILDLIRSDTRYSYEAYEFVCEAVTFTQERLGRLPEEDDDPDTDYHVSGAELARGTCELAVQEYGMMASVVFRQWGVHATDDIGRLVFALIKAGRLSQSDRDEPDDFHDLFDVDKLLTDGAALTADDAYGADR